MTSQPEPVLTVNAYGNPAVNTPAATYEYQQAVATLADRWVVGACGHEQPSQRLDGRWVLYVFNPGTREHGWLDLATDVVTDGEPA